MSAIWLFLSSNEPYSKKCMSQTESRARHSLYAANRPRSLSLLSLSPSLSLPLSPPLSLPLSVYLSVCLSVSASHSRGEPPFNDNFYLVRHPHPAIERFSLLVRVPPWTSPAELEMHDTTDPRGHVVEDVPRSRITRFVLICDLTS